MKRWWFHTVACILNCTTATLFYILATYDLFTKSTSDDSRLAWIFIGFPGYLVYLISDIWGVKLYYRFKNQESLSNQERKGIYVIIFFLGLIQLSIGSFAFLVTKNLIFNFHFIQNGLPDSFEMIGYCILVVFYSAIIVFFGYIFLLRAIAKNKILMTKEIENIGQGN